MQVYQWVRDPAVAGRFYDADPSRCAAAVEQLTRLRDSEAAAVASLPARCVGAVVPHAGWICSGAVAGRTLRALSRHTDARTFMMTGSVHTMNLSQPALDCMDAWATPLGDVLVDADLRRALAQLPGFDAIDEAHTREHSLEVQLPLMQHVFGHGLRIVPCMIPPGYRAAEWGAAIGRVLAEWPQPVAMICSVDLTHYGPNYGFTPHGLGPDGIRWAHDVNDRRLLDLVESLDADAVLDEAAQHHNTCGGGALAATLAACRAMGATAGHVIEHTGSDAVLTPLGHADHRNSVGYAGVVLG